MANNRMWLVCKPCEARNVPHAKEARSSRRLLAKFYPATGWYQFATEEQINDWFDAHRNCDQNADPYHGPTSIGLTYESLEDEPGGRVVTQTGKEAWP